MAGVLHGPVLYNSGEGTKSGQQVWQVWQEPQLVSEISLGTSLPL
jgi:hypothetical protein